MRTLLIAQRIVQASALTIFMFAVSCSNRPYRVSLRPPSKAQLQSIIDKEINKLATMSPKERRFASARLDAIVAKSGTPEEKRQYAALIGKAGPSIR